jgi:hypothetical protein
MTRDGVDGPCRDCGADEVCEPIDGRNLCNDCWHRARYQKQPWGVERVDSPDTIARIRTWAPEYTVYRTGMAYLEHEAKEFAVEMTRRSGGREEWKAVPVERWYGDRIAHPGYMQKRRRAIREEFGL